MTTFVSIIPLQLILIGVRVMIFCMKTQHQQLPYTT